MRWCLLFFLLAGSARAAPDEAGFVELLTPAKASEWQQCGQGGLSQDRGVWTTQNEVTAAGPRGGVHWYAAKTFANFVLRFEFRADRPGADSGVFVRIPGPVKNDDPWSLPKRSHEVHLSGGGTKMPSGSIMSFQEASGVRQKAPGQWNQMEMVADGPELRITLNGKPVNTFRSAFAGAGYIGIQNHYTGPMQFRNFRIKELP